MQQAFIFIGRSGCGKGTQIELLTKLLKEKDPSRDSIYIYPGEQLRKFKEGPSLTQRKTKDIYDQGLLLPEFLTVTMWTQIIIDKYTGREHLIFDGTPRRLHEAGALHSCFEFYGLKQPWVINIDISEEEALKRLLKRKRQDDSVDDIKRRLNWYEEDVVPALNYYDGNPAYKFIKINGERSIEEIHQDIVKKLGLS